MSLLEKLYQHLVFQIKTVEDIFIQLLKLVVSFVLVLGTTSCSEYLVGKPNRPTYIEIKSDGKLACLDNITSDMQKFLDSEGTDHEIDQTITCINATLTELQVRIEGSVEATAFTVTDIYKIFSKFASRMQLSEVAAQNIISLKAALLGGESSKITKNEINLLKNYLLLIGEEAKKLKPYIKLFYFNESDKSYSKMFIKEATDQLNVSLKNLYKASQMGVSNYSFNNFKDLVINVLNLGADKKSMVEVAGGVSTVLGGKEPLLSEADRMSYIDNITEVLRLYALFANGYAKFEITSSPNLNETLNFIESCIQLIENSLQYKKTQIISVQTIDALVGALAKSNLLTYKMTGYTMAMFYRTVFVRLFESGANGSVMGFSGIRKIHLRNIKHELGLYKLYSKIIERVAGEELFAARGITSAPLGEIQHAMSLLDLSAETEILGAYDVEMQARIINNANQIRSEFTNPLPVIYHKNKIGEASNQDSWSQMWSDLARGFYTTMLARLIMQGWGQIYPLENISTNYLSAQAMANWYSEFKHFAVEIKSFDPRSTMNGFTIFNLANLFTRSANGDKEIRFKELVESLSISLTSSGGLYNEISNGLENAKCNLAELDIFDNHWNMEPCFYQVLRTNYKLYYSSLPHLIQYLDSLGAGQFKSYFEAAINVVRVDENNAGSKVETSDIRSMNSLLHFIENIFITHDLNSNGLLSEAEIRQAYPKFEATAQDFAYKVSKSQIEDFTSWKGDVAGYGCFSEAELIRESFVFMIYNGRNPTQSDLNSFPCFRDKPLLNFSGEVDRRTLINTFKALKSVLGT